MKLGQVYLPSQHGSTIDVWGNKVRNNKGFVHNACEVSLTQHALSLQLLDKVIVKYRGDDLEYVMSSVSESRPVFTLGSSSVMYVGSAWRIADLEGTDSSQDPLVDGRYPPKLGWPNLGGYPVEISWESNWITDIGYIVDRNRDNLNATKNLTGSEVLQWKKMAGGGCGLKKTAHYNQGAIEVFTLGEYNQAIRWAGDPTCGDGVVDFP